MLILVLAFPGSTSKYFSVLLVRVGAIKKSTPIWYQRSKLTARSFEQFYRSIAHSTINVLYGPTCF